MSVCDACSPHTVFIIAHQFCSSHHCPFLLPLLFCIHLFFLDIPLSSNSASILSVFRITATSKYTQCNRRILNNRLRVSETWSYSCVMPKVTSLWCQKWAVLLSFRLKNDWLTIWDAQEGTYKKPMFAFWMILFTLRSINTMATVVPVSICVMCACMSQNLLSLALSNHKLRWIFQRLLSEQMSAVIMWCGTILMKF